MSAPVPPLTARQQRAAPLPDLRAPAAGTRLPCVSPRPGQRGLSLIELMMAIVMMALVLGLGLPSLTDMVDSNRISRQATWLQSDLRLARAEAVRRGAPVALCASSNGSACTPDSTWRDGWIVFSNRQGDGVFNGTGGDEILRAQPGWGTGDTTVTTPNTNRMVFNAEGFSANLRGGNTAITIRSESGSARSTRCLLMNLAGTVTMQAGSACP